jgi:hypothetical protein
LHHDKIDDAAHAEHPFEEPIMTKILHGKVHGSTIELNEDLGFPEGQEVEVSVRTVQAASPREPGEGFLRTAGALADDPYWDAIREAIHQERKNDTRSKTSE